MAFPKALFFLAISINSSAFANEVCDILTHVKLSLDDFAEVPTDNINFFFRDTSELTRLGKLTISGNNFKIEYEEFEMAYECLGARNDPCVEKTGDARFIGEARVDKSVGAVVQISRQVAGGFNPFSRGGVADAGLTLWKIVECK